MSKLPIVRAPQSTAFRLSTLLFLTGLAVAVRAELSPTWPDQKNLTPESLVRCFADFTFELIEPVQEPEIFLQRKRGDCDDFAKLVSRTLEQHGYKTRIVVVMMDRETHVVCYVQERKGYLDYNLRAAAEPVVACDGTLEGIAQKVADSFRSKWWLASEIRYDGIKPVFVNTTFPPARPAVKPVMASATVASSTSLPSAAAVAPKPASPKPEPAVLGLVKLPQ